MFILILKIIGICIFLVCLGFLAYWGMALLKGDCLLRMLKGKMTPLKVEDMDRESIVLSFTIPIVNHREAESVRLWMRLSVHTFLLNSMTKQG